MRKNTILSSFVVIGLAGVLLLHDISCPHPGKDMLYDEMGHAIGETLWRDRALDAKMARWAIFAKVAEEAERELVTGGLSLAEAVARIHRASQAHYPEYMEYVARCEAGSTDAERIARNVIRHVQDADAELVDVVQRLERELALMLKQRQDIAPAGMQVSMA